MLEVRYVILFEILVKFFYIKMLEMWGVIFLGKVWWLDGGVKLLVLFRYSRLWGKYLFFLDDNIKIDSKFYF